MAIVPTTNAMQLSADNILPAKSLSEPVYVKVLTTDAVSRASLLQTSLFLLNLHFLLLEFIQLCLC